MTEAPAFLRGGPVLLRPDNFTPPARTPWGGHTIGARYKLGLVPGAEALQIGEAWEFSCDPELPSRLLDHPEWSLPGLIARHPEAILSPAAVSNGHTCCEILVKLLDAAEPLSLQVHPADDDADLRPSESGKPESWLVLAAAPGAGLYLGFSRPLGVEELRTLLMSGADAESILHFHPVKAGEYYEIAPGVPHAIGPGVTLLEPQRVLQGKSGRTYRLWDWGRTYLGRPRELDLEQGLRLVEPQRQVGRAFAESLLRRPRVTTAGGCEIRSFPANPHYATTLVRCPKGAALHLDIDGGYGALLVLAGQIDSGGKTLRTGQPALLPHAALPLAIKADLDSELALITPAHATPTIRP